MPPAEGLAEMQVRDRIRELRRVKASELRPNPRNWRLHPQPQQDALRGVLAEIGYADALLTRELPDGTLMLIDGHLRAETTPDMEVPVLIVDLDEVEADKVLATLDPLAGLATGDPEKVKGLFGGIDTSSEALERMLREVAGKVGVQLDMTTSCGEPPAGVTPPERGSNWDILQGDVIEMLRTLPDESVHCVVTSPPYWGLRDYGTGTWEGGDPSCDHEPDRTSSKSTLEGGKDTQGAARIFREGCPKCGARRIDQQLGLEPTPEEFVAKMVEVFAEVRRVLRADGTCWMNLGDCYASIGERIHGGFNGSTPAPQRLKGQRLGAPMNLAGTGLKSKDLVGIPWRVAFALQADGWYLRSDIIWHKPNPMPESVTDRPTKSHEYVFLLAKSEAYWYDADAVAEPAIHAGETRTTTAKSFAGQATGAGVRATGNAVVGSVVEIGNTRNRRTVWTIATQPYSEAHFATFPEKLVEPCVLAGTSEYGCCAKCGAPWERQKTEALGGAIGSSWGDHSQDAEAGNFKIASSKGYKPGTTTGWQPICSCNADTIGCTVLDPFCGSGTTGVVALRHRCRFLGIELSPEYIQLARKRIADSLAAPAEGLPESVADEVPVNA
jgi:DNA modification methylase